MYEQFKKTAEGVSAEVHRFDTRSDASVFIAGFLLKEGVSDAPNSYALWAESPFLQNLNPALFAPINGLKFQVTRELAAHAKFGISQMDFALADTGTLVQNSTKVEQRLVSTLCNIHIAVVPTSKILPDMSALLAVMHPDECGYMAMITGPSRTADIERVLTIGVHGPERLVIVCVDDLGGAH